MENIDTKVESTEDKVEETKKTDVPNDKAEEKASDTKKDDSVEKANSLELDKATKTIEELNTQLVTAQEQIVEIDNVRRELDTAKADIEKANGIVKEYEDMLNKMIDEKMKVIPEEYAELVPSNMTIVQQLEWLAKAESKNLFNKSKANTDVEIGKPMGASVEAKVNTDKMSSGNILSMAYNVLKK